MTEPHFDVPDSKPVVKLYRATYTGNYGPIRGCTAQVICRDDQPDQLKAKFDDPLEAGGFAYGWHPFDRADFDVDYFNILDSGTVSELES